jgi:hypothetical protein
MRCRMSNARLLGLRCERLIGRFKDPIAFLIPPVPQNGSMA